MTPNLAQKVEGAIYGQAIGDAMGAPVEGWPSHRIAAQFNSVEQFLPTTHGGDPASGKGNGRVTDDTLMMEALIRAYIHCGDHMDAYDYEKFFIPEIADKTMWVPERQAHILLLDRLFWAEKYPWIRLVQNRAEPRSAGIGNMVNCGVAMYIMPVGAVNAGDPHAAYQEAAAFGLAHNESYAIEAAAVMAACAAHALSNHGSIDGVLEIASARARDGTGDAIRAVLRVVKTSDDIQSFIQKTRAAMRAYDLRAPFALGDNPLRVTGANNCARPSRLHAIEELPIALGALKYGAGDFSKTIHAGVFYGVDCDSIAGMAGMLFGALFGVERLPQHLRIEADKANQRDYHQLAADFLQVIDQIFEKDAERFAARRHARGQS